MSCLHKYIIIIIGTGVSNLHWPLKSDPNQKVPTQDGKQNCLWQLAVQNHISLMFNSYSVATVCWSVLHKGHVLGEVTVFFLLVPLLLSSPLSLLPLTHPYFLLDLWLCQLFLLSFLFSRSLFLTLTPSPLLPSLTFTFLSKLCLLCFCLFLPPRPEPPPSLATFLCSSSWRLRLCSSLLLAFLVRYRYSSSTLFVSPLLSAHIFTFPKSACLVSPVSVE